MNGTLAVENSYLFFREWNARCVGYRELNEPTPEKNDTLRYNVEDWSIMM